MKKVLFIILTVMAFAACKSVHDVINPLQLGMMKQDVLQQIGKDYALESITDSPDGVIEILRTPKNDNIYPAYLLVFSDNKLVEIKKDHKPIVPQQNVNVTQEKKSE